MKKLFVILLLVLVLFCAQGGVKWKGLPVDNLLPNFSPVKEKFIDFNLFPLFKPEIEIEINGEGGTVVEQKKGKTLYKKNSETRFYPASTTKIMTALIALERGNLEDEITITEDVLNLEPGSKTVFLKAGDQISLEVLLYGLLLESGNDCALAIARHLAGSEEDFVEMMNRKAEDLQLKDTHFSNPHGLHNSEHYTTPRNLALIARAAFKYPKFREIIQTESYTAKFSSLKGVIVRNWVNTNKMIDRGNQFYDSSVIGSKTGYTEASGHCLVTFAKKGKRELIIVVLKDGKDEVYLDTLALLKAVR